MSFVTGNLKKINNTASIETIYFYSVQVAIVGNSEMWHGGYDSVRPNQDGSFSIELAPGDYDVKIGNDTRVALRISVLNDDLTYPIEDLASASVSYPPNTPAGGAQPVASTTTAGTVKVDSDPGGGAVPVVPLLSTVQSMIAAAGSGIVNLGGVPTIDASHSTVFSVILSNGIANLQIVNGQPVWTATETP